MLPAVLIAFVVVQVAYLGYAVAKRDTEIFVHRGEGAISDLLAHSEYGSFSRGYRLYRLFRDHCRGCSVEIGAGVPFSPEQLAEIGRVEIRGAASAACATSIAEAAGRATARRFETATDETPYKMFKAKDVAAWGVPVTVVIDRNVKTYRACRDAGRDAILPVVKGAG